MKTSTAASPKRAKSTAAPASAPPAARPSAPRKTRAATPAVAPAADAAPAADVPPREERIRMAAYALYVQRGQIGGRDLDDWLEAEALVDAQGAGGQ